MSIWQRIFGPPPDNGDRMVRIPADLVAAVAEVTDRPGKYILDAVRQRLRGVEVANDERSTMELELTNLIARSFEGDKHIPFMAIEAAAGLLVEAGWRPTKPYLYFADNRMYCAECNSQLAAHGHAKGCRIAEASR